MIVIGITGTLGAGKGTIVNYLTGSNAYVHFSVREFLISEINKRGLTVNRDSMVEVANELRALNGPAFIISELYKLASELNSNCIIESIRTEGEVNELRGKGNFILFAVDADAKLRYQRIQLRGSETDQVSFEQFLENEQREMLSENPNKQNLRKCIEMADFRFVNNKSKEELYKAVAGVLETITKNFNE